MIPTTMKNGAVPGGLKKTPPPADSMRKNDIALSAKSPIQRHSTH